MTMIDTRTISRAADAARIAASAVGRTFLLGDHTALCLADAATTGGAFSMFDVTVEPGGGTPLHVHANEDETFYIVAGRFAFTEAGRTVIATPGKCIFAARGRRHRWQNVGDTSGRMIVLASPGGFERFFGALERCLKTGAASGVDIRWEPLLAANAVMAQFGIETLRTEGLLPCLKG